MQQVKRIGGCLAALAVLAPFLAPFVAVPASADDAALRRELEDLKQQLSQLEGLKKRVSQIEDELARAKKEPAPAPEAQAVRVRNGSKLQFSGFAEMRMTNLGNPLGDRIRNGELDFQVTRFRPRFIYTMDPHFQAELQFNASTRSAGATSTNARDAYLEYHNAGYWLRFGQQKIPFGYQVFREGDEARAALERARIFGVLFPDERDIGFVASTRSHNPHAAVFSIGVVDGDGVNRSDGDPDKSAAARVEAPVGRHQVVGASLYTGTGTTARPAPQQNEFRSRDRQAVGVEHRLELGHFSTQLEYVWARAFGADLNGGYGQLLYNTGRSGNVFVRYDLFEPNTHASGDLWHRTGFGWYRDFTRQFRLTAEYDWVHNELTKTTNDHTFGVELQSNF
jgi:hypothetical protein